MYRRSCMLTTTSSSTTTRARIRASQSRSSGPDSRRQTSLRYYYFSVSVARQKISNTYLHIIYLTHLKNGLKPSKNRFLWEKHWFFWRYGGGFMTCLLILYNTYIGNMYIYYIYPWNYILSRWWDLLSWETWGATLRAWPDSWTVTSWSTCSTLFSPGKYEHIFYHSPPPQY